MRSRDQGDDRDEPGEVALATMDEGERKFSRREVELVLREAAEMALAETGDGLLSREEVVSLAREAGISEDAVRRALARGEVRSALARRGGSRLLDRMIGPPDTTLVRDAPVPIDEAKRLFSEHMAADLMTVARHHGDRIQWQPQTSPWATVKRFFSPRASRDMAQLRSVEASFQSLDAEWTAIGLRLDDGPHRDRLGIVAGVWLTAGLGALSVAALSAASGNGPAVSVVAAAGGLVAGGIAGGVRAGYRRARQRVADAGERLLDLVAHRVGPEKAGGPAGFVDELQRRLGENPLSSIKRALEQSASSGSSGKRGGGGAPPDRS